MFGLENGNSGKSKKKADESQYDAEQEMSDPKKYIALKRRLEQEIQNIKTTQRSGNLAKENFGTLATILVGYEAALKVVIRFREKK